MILKLRGMLDKIHGVGFFLWNLFYVSLCWSFTPVMILKMFESTTDKTLRWLCWRRRSIQADISVLRQIQPLRTLLSSNCCIRLLRFHPWDWFLWLFIFKPYEYWSKLLRLLFMIAHIPHLSFKGRLFQKVYCRSGGWVIWEMQWQEIWKSSLGEILMDSF